ncbi:MAG: sugar transferase [Pseudomonadales bacterium]|nr:sugar transferase [Pseudomonadales bacterium]
MAQPTSSTVLTASNNFTLLVAIVCSSGWPIFYRQVRTGENGKQFSAIKFRTMGVDAEVDGAQFAQEEDPRITRIGKILRKFRIDEIPQFWNMLKGDMSFIRPRRERPEFIQMLKQDIPYYDLRHMIKPGITGYAQVKYGYGDSAEDAAEKLQYDFFFIKNYSLILDISILVRSIKVILFGTGR